VPQILIVGFGSAGRRHALNLAQLGARIFVTDTRADRLKEGLEGAVKGAFPSLKAALSSARFDGAVIATPTVFHVDQAQSLLNAGVKLLLEKPVSIDVASACRLAAREAKAGVPILLGYTWRWWPALQALRQKLQGGAIGHPVRGEFVMASHLEDWHPGEELADFFMSKAALGGGALLDESHWLDQMIWLLGMPAEISATVERISSLPIDSDDHVELQAFYGGSLRARVHLDLTTRPTERSIAVYGESGALRWNAETNVVAEWHVATPTWRETSFAGERNDMFHALAGDFLAIIAGRLQPSCTLADGIAVLHLIEAARISHRDRGQRVKVRVTADAAH
jgi:predicted dehydrogenase